MLLEVPQWPLRESQDDVISAQAIGLVLIPGLSMFDNAQSDLGGVFWTAS
jgi:hypothetical protein